MKGFYGNKPASGARKNKAKQSQSSEYTAETWQWLIKNTDRRTLPLTEDLVVTPAEHQSRQPDRYAYVFVPPGRYNRIQELCKKGKWTLSDSWLKVINNFRRKFESEYDVMKLAGYADFQTTHQFYLAVADDLNDRARTAASTGVCQNPAHIWRAPAFLNKYGLTHVWEVVILSQLRKYRECSSVGRATAF